MPAGYRWGLQLQALHEAPAHLSAAAGYVPDVAWLMATTDAAVIVAFRGADPFTQVPHCHAPTK